MLIKRDHGKADMSQWMKISVFISVVAAVIVVVAWMIQPPAENHYFKCEWAGWKNSPQCKDYTPLRKTN